MWHIVTVTLLPSFSTNASVVTVLGWLWLADFSLHHGCVFLPFVCLSISHWIPTIWLLLGRVLEVFVLLRISFREAGKSPGSWLCCLVGLGQGLVQGHHSSALRQGLPECSTHCPVIWEAFQSGWQGQVLVPGLCDTRWPFKYTDYPAGYSGGPLVSLQASLWALCPCRCSVLQTAAASISV